MVSDVLRQMVRLKTEPKKKVISHHKIHLSHLKKFPLHNSYL